MVILGIISILIVIIYDLYVKYSYLKIGKYEMLEKRLWFVLNSCLKLKCLFLR